MLRYHYRLVGLLIACVLIFLGPASAAGKSTAKGSRDSAAANECRGRGHSNDHPHKDRSDACEQDDEASPSSEEDDEPRNGNGNGQGKGHDDPPGNGNGNGRAGDGRANGKGNSRGHDAPPGHDRREQEAAPGPPGSHPSTPNDAAPPVHGSPARVSIDVAVDRTVAQVGAIVTYEIEITNAGATSTALTVRNEVPAEVNFLSATEAPVVTDANSLTWTVPALEPGSVTTIQWTGRVARLGDLDALNVVTVDGRGADAAPVETHTYLASVQGVRFQRSPSEPDWGSHTERRVVFRAAPPHAPSTAGSSAGSAAQLPRTGVPVLELSLIAALLVLAGLVLTGRGKRHAAAAMMVVLIAAACTSEDPPPSVAERTETPAEEDEVLGTRISRNTPEPPGDAADAIPGTDDEPSGNEGPDGPATDPQDAAPDPTDATDATDATDGTEVVREVVLVTVPNEPPQPEPVPSTAGSNSISLTWDEQNRSIVTATSSRMLTAGSEVDLLASVSDAGEGMRVGVTLTNTTSDRRLLVRGHLIVDVTGSDGSIVQLSSPPIDEILDPGDEVTADFVLALPSGSYAIGPLFSAS